MITIRRHVPDGVEFSWNDARLEKRFVKLAERQVFTYSDTPLSHVELADRLDPEFLADFRTLLQESGHVMTPDWCFHQTYRQFKSVDDDKNGFKHVYRTNISSFAYASPARLELKSGKDWHLAGHFPTFSGRDHLPHYVTVRDSYDSDGQEILDLECRFPSGEKFAAVSVSGDKLELAHVLAAFLSDPDMVQSVVTKMFNNAVT